MAHPRILCIRTDRIGDMLISTPVFRRLRELYPDAIIDIIASPAGALALEDNPDINHVSIYDKKHPRTLPSLLPTLWTFHDIVINLNSKSHTASFLAALARGKTKVGFTKGQYAPWSGRPEDAGHISARLLREMELQLRLPHYEQPNIQSRFAVPDAVIQEIAAQYPKSAGCKRIGMFIGNIKKTDMRWPIENFVELAGVLIKASQVLEVWIIAGKGDVPLLDAFSGMKAPQLHTFVAQTSLQQTAAFLMTCDAFVTSTSGPQHLAGAMGTPMVSITMPWSERSWTPRGPLNFSAIADNEETVHFITVRQVYETLNKTMQGCLPDYPL